MGDSTLKTHLLLSFFGDVWPCRQDLKKIQDFLNFEIKTEVIEDSVKMIFFMIYLISVAICFETKIKYKHRE